MPEKRAAASRPRFGNLCGNIIRISWTRIDPATVFFEVAAERRVTPDEGDSRARYLQESLPKLGFQTLRYPHDGPLRLSLTSPGGGEHRNDFETGGRTRESTISLKSRDAIVGACSTASRIGEILGDTTARTDDRLLVRLPGCGADREAEEILALGSPGLNPGPELTVSEAERGLRGPSAHGPTLRTPRHGSYRRSSASARETSRSSASRCAVEHSAPRPGRDGESIRIRGSTRGRRSVFGTTGSGVSGIWRIYITCDATTCGAGGFLVRKRNATGSLESSGGQTGHTDAPRVLDPRRGLRPSSIFSHFPRTTRGLRRRLACVDFRRPAAYGSRLEFEFSNPSGAICSSSILCPRTGSSSRDTLINLQLTRRGTLHLRALLVPRSVEAIARGRGRRCLN